VLVILALLLGGVLKDRTHHWSTGCRNLISQQDGIKPLSSVQDRFRALPGDYASGATNIPNSAKRQPATDGSRTTPPRPLCARELLAWNHLTAAGFLNGSFTS